MIVNIGNFFAGIIGGIAQELQPQQTGPSRLVAIGPIGIPSGLCVEGSAIADNVIYEDNAPHGFSAGDTITVILDNCLSKLGYPDDNVYLSGNSANLPAIKFSIDNVVEGIVKGKLDLSIAVKDEFGTSTLAGTMPAEAFIGFLPSAGITLGKDNSTAQNNYISIKEGAEHCNLDAS